MESFNTGNSRTFLTRHRVAISVVAFFVLATATFAAAGGVEMVRSWFATISVNGKVVHTGPITPDENGEVELVLPPDAVPEDGVMNVEVSLEGDGAAGDGTETVTITSIRTDSDEVTAETSNTPEPDAKSEDK